MPRGRALAVLLVSAAESSGGTSFPVSPSTIISGRPPTAEATTGLPTRMASIATRPNPSHREGTTTTSQAAICDATAVRSSHPKNSTPSELRRSNPPANTDSPTTRVDTRFSRGCTASINTSTPFCRSNLPTNNTFNRPSRHAAALLVDGEICSPFSMTTSLRGMMPECSPAIFSDWEMQTIAAHRRDRKRSVACIARRATELRAVSNTQPCGQ
jgi:hypothetical protein